MQKWLWKNTDFLPKKGLFQLTRKKGKNPTPVGTLMLIWILFSGRKLCINKNINIIFFHSCVSEKTYVEKLEMTIIHYSKFPWPLSESSVGIRNVQCFLINLIYTVGSWNATNNHNIEYSSLFTIKTIPLFTGATWLLISCLPLEETEAGFVGLRKKP